MNQQYNAAQHFNQVFQKNLEQVLFPSDKLSARWRKYALRAMHSASPMSLGMKAADMASLYETLKAGKPITMFGFACLSNNLEQKSSRDLGLSMNRYIELMQEANQYSVLWNQLSEDIKKTVGEQMAKEAEELQKKQKAEGSANGSANGKVSHLPPIPKRK